LTVGNLVVDILTVSNLDVYINRYCKMTWQRKDLKTFLNFADCFRHTK
jgi:hypothetical protein